MPARFLTGAVLAAVLLGGSVAANDALKSGPPVGARNNRSGFFPQFVTGPGEPRCPV